MTRMNHPTRFPHTFLLSLFAAGGALTIGTLAHAAAPESAAVEHAAGWMQDADGGSQSGGGSGSSSSSSSSSSSKSSSSSSASGSARSEGSATARGTSSTTSSRTDSQDATTTTSGRSGASVQSTSSTSSNQDGTHTFETRISISENGRRLEMVRNNQGLSATLDGKPVPKERLIEANGKVRVLDEQGATVFEVSAPTPTGFSYGSVKEGAAAPRVFTTTGTMTVQPRSMIGITMDMVDEATAVQLGVKPENVILIAGVTKDLAAHKAGLKPFDIVIKVDGKEPVTAEIIREAITSREPGERVALRVLRQAKPLDVDVTVEAYDPVQLTVTENFNYPGNHGRGAEEFSYVFGDSPDAMLKAEQLAQRLRGMEELVEVHGLRADDLRLRALEMAHEFPGMAINRYREAQPMLEELRKRIEENLKSSALDEGAMRTVREALENAARQVGSAASGYLMELHPMMIEIMSKDDGERALVLPHAAITARRVDAAEQTRAALSASAMDEQLRRIETRMERMETLMRQLVEKLDKSE